MEPSQRRTGWPTVLSPSFAWQSQSMKVSLTSVSPHEFEARARRMPAIPNEETSTEIVPEESGTGCIGGITCVTPVPGNTGRNSTLRHRPAEPFAASQQLIFAVLVELSF